MRLYFVISGDAKEKACSNEGGSTMLLVDQHACSLPISPQLSEAIHGHYSYYGVFQQICVSPSVQCVSPSVQSGPYKEKLGKRRCSLGSAIYCTTFPSDPFTDC